MRKYMPIFMAIIIGIVFGNLIFDSYETEEVMASYGNVYMLQYGAYTDKSVLNKSISKLESDSYIIKNENDVYYVYLGITTDYFNALSIKDIYDDKDVFIYIKQDYLGNSEMINKIHEYDSLINKEDSTFEIIELEKELLKIYKELL